MNYLTIDLQHNTSINKGLIWKKTHYCFNREGKCFSLKYPYWILTDDPSELQREKVNQGAIPKIITEKTQGKLEFPVESGDKD